MMTRPTRNKTNPPRRFVFAGCCLLVMMIVSGCASKGDSWKFAKSWDLRRAVGLKSNQPEPTQIPTRLVATWSDTVLYSQGKKPERGFGGRLTFFGRDSKDAVRVDGQLVVYAYDETDRESHETHPTRRFVFPREQFARHESESGVGASYSVWLPWDAIGGPRKTISLIARFEPHQGSLIVGEQTRHMLPGTTLAATQSDAADGNLRLVQHQGSEQNKPAVVTAGGQALSSTSTRRQTTSIPLPKHWR